MGGREEPMFQGFSSLLSKNQLSFKNLLLKGNTPVPQGGLKVFRQALYKENPLVFYGAVVFLLLKGRSSGYSGRVLRLA